MILLRIPVIRALLVLNVLVWGVVIVLAVRPAAADDNDVRVTRIVDGDTVVVTRLYSDAKTTVRILGIDTPETKKPRSPVQCWGPEATQFARDTLLDQVVRMVPDATQDDRDRYGRALRYIIKPDGWDYSVEAARAGAARAYVFNPRRPPVEAPLIAAAQAEAQNATPLPRGLWGPPCEGKL